MFLNSRSVPPNLCVGDQPKEFDDFTQGALQETTVVTVPLSPAASAPAGPNATANGTSQVSTAPTPFSKQLDRERDPRIPSSRQVRHACTRPTHNCMLHVACCKASHAFLNAALVQLAVRIQSSFIYSQCLWLYDQKLHKKERSRNKSSTLGQTQKKKKKRCSRGQKSTQNHSRLRAANWRSSQLPQLVNGI